MGIDEIVYTSRINVCYITPHNLYNNRSFLIISPHNGNYDNRFFSTIEMASSELAISIVSYLCILPVWNL